MRVLRVIFGGFIFVLNFFALSCVHASSLPDSVKPVVSTLENGLTVIISEMPESPMVSVYGLVRVGGASEGEYLGCGLAHFTEHMVFKGTQTRATGDIPKEVQALGGTINASTGLDYTIFTLTVPKEHFRKAADILSDMLNNARFDAEDIEYERKVVFNEMRMHDDRPERVLSKRVMETVYTRHPYRLPVIGFEDLLAALTRDDFIAFYRQHYAPNNMVISIAGGITSQEALPVVEQAFGEYPRQKFSQRLVMQEPEQLSSRRRHVPYSTPVVRMSMVYQGVSITDPDLFALDTLAMIMGRGRSSRLQKSLVEEKQLVKSVSVSNFTPMDKGGFEIESVFAADENIQDVETAVREEVQTIKNEPVTKSELDIAKKRVLKDHVSGQLTSAGVAYSTAVDFALTGNADFSRVYAQGIDQVSAEDVKRVANVYLDNNRLSVVALEPEAAVEKQKVKIPEEKTDIHREVLPNGIIVLMKEDHRVSLAICHVVMHGGVRLEPEGKNGLSSLTAGLWTKAAGKYDRDAFARVLDESGIGLSGFSGRNSIGLKMSSLTQDFDKGLEMLTLALKKPHFSKQDLALAKEQRLFAIAKRDEDITDFTTRETLKNLFPDHVLGLTELGEKEDIESITRKDILHFYKQCLSSGKIVISIFGDIDADAMLVRLKDLFGDMRVRGSEPAAQTVVEPIKEHEALRYLDKEQAVFAVACRGAAIDQPDRFGLEVLGAVIGSPFRGRMFSRIREDLGLSYRLGGGFHPAVDGGFLLFFAQAASENGDVLKTEFTHILNAIQINGPEKEELDDIKAYLKGNFERSIETPQSLGFLTALDELYGLGFDAYQKYSSQIDAVSGEDVKRLANDYCAPAMMSSTLTLPER